MLPGFPKISTLRPHETAAIPLIHRYLVMLCVSGKVLHRPVEIAAESCLSFQQIQSELKGRFTAEAAVQISDFENAC